MLHEKLGVKSVFDLSMPISAFTRLCEAYERAVAAECEARDHGGDGFGATADFVMLLNSEFWSDSECDGPRFELPSDQVSAVRIDSENEQVMPASVQRS